jgi:hypothetical protein
MWETIVLNLVSNAVKFTLDGSITVRVEPSEQAVRVQVADTGIGIPAADLPRLFERFYRVSGPRGRSVEGTGIGLSMVHSLVGLHGGTIDVDSTPDVGTTVTIELPASPAAPTTPQLSARPENPFLVEAQQWLRSEPADPAAPADDEHLVLIAMTTRTCARTCSGSWPSTGARRPWPMAAPPSRPSAGNTRTCW